MIAGGIAAFGNSGVLGNIGEIIGNAILNAVAHLFYTVWVAGATVINLIEGLFRRFAGLESVAFEQVDAQGNLVTAPGDISVAIIRHPTIVGMFNALVIFAMVMLIFFTILQIIREQYTNKHGGSPYVFVFRMFKGMVLFMFITAAAVVGVQLSTTVLRALNSATGGSDHRGSLAGQIFIGMAQGANKLYMAQDSSRARNQAASILTRFTDPTFIWTGLVHGGPILWYGQNSPDIDIEGAAAAVPVEEWFISDGGILYFNLFKPEGGLITTVEDFNAPANGGGVLWARNDAGVAVSLQRGANMPTAHLSSVPWYYHSYEPNFTQNRFDLGLINSPHTRMVGGGLVRGGYHFHISFRGSRGIINDSVDHNGGYRNAIMRRATSLPVSPALASLGGVSRNYFYLMHRGPDDRGSFNMTFTGNPTMRRAYETLNARPEIVRQDDWRPNSGVGREADYAFWINNVMASRGVVNWNGANHTLRIGHSGGGLETRGPMSFMNIAAVSSLYFMWEMSWIVGFAGLFIVLGVLLSFLFGMIQRVVQLGVLYVFSPVTLSFFPFDDGQMFNSAFVQPFYKTAISAMAPIISLNIFFPVWGIMGNINWYGGENPNWARQQQNNLINVFVLLAVVSMLPKMRSTINSMLGAEEMQEKSLTQSFKDGWAGITKGTTDLKPALKKWDDARRTIKDHKAAIGQTGGLGSYLKKKNADAWNRTKATLTGNKKHLSKEQRAADRAKKRQKILADKQAQFDKLKTPKEKMEFLRNNRHFAAALGMKPSDYMLGGSKLSDMDKYRNLVADGKIKGDGSDQDILAYLNGDKGRQDAMKKALGITSPGALKMSDLQSLKNKGILNSKNAEQRANDLTAFQAMDDAKKLALGFAGKDGLQKYLTSLDTDAKARTELGVEQYKANEFKKKSLGQMIKTKMMRDDNPYWNAITDMDNGLFAQSGVVKWWDSHGFVQRMRRVEKIREDRKKRLSDSPEVYGYKRSFRELDKLCANEVAREGQEDVLKEYAEHARHFGTGEDAAEKYIEGKEKIANEAKDKVALEHFSSGDSLKNLIVNSGDKFSLSGGAKVALDKGEFDNPELLKAISGLTNELIQLDNESFKKKYYGENDKNKVFVDEVIKKRKSIENTATMTNARSAIKEIGDISSVLKDEKGNIFKDIEALKKSQAGKRARYDEENKEALNILGHKSIDDEAVRKAVKVYKQVNGPEADLAMARAAKARNEDSYTLTRDSSAGKAGDVIDISSERAFNQFAQKANKDFEEQIVGGNEMSSAAARKHLEGVAFRNLVAISGDTIDAIISSEMAVEKSKQVMTTLDIMSTETQQIVRDPAFADFIYDGNFSGLAEEIYNALDGKEHKLRQDLLDKITNKGELRQLADMYYTMFGDVSGEMRGSGLASAANMFARSYRTSFLEAENKMLESYQSMIDNRQEQIQQAWLNKVTQVNGLKNSDKFVGEMIKTRLDDIDDYHNVSLEEMSRRKEEISKSFEVMLKNDVDMLKKHCEDNGMMDKFEELKVEMQDVANNKEREREIRHAYRSAMESFEDEITNRNYRDTGTAAKQRVARNKAREAQVLGATQFGNQRLEGQ